MVLVKADGKTYTFHTSKARKSQLMKRSPREVKWTILYRRKHRKGMEEEATKKRSRRSHKSQKGIEGASLTEILAKRNMKPEVRKAQREQAIRVLKENNRAAENRKAPAAVAPVKKADKMAKKPVPKVAKNLPKGGKSAKNKKAPAAVAPVKKADKMAKKPVPKVAKNLP